MSVKIFSAASFSFLLSLLLVNPSFAEIYKCNGAYQTTPCKPGESGGAAKNLPPIQKYDWLEHSKKKVAPVAKKPSKSDDGKARARLAGAPAEKPARATKAKIAKPDSKKPAVESLAKKLSPPTKAVAAKPKKSTPTKRVDYSPQIEVDPSGEEGRLLALIQDAGRLRFMVEDQMKKQGVKKTEEQVALLWTSLETTCRKVAGKGNERARTMCTRGWQDLLSIANRLEAQGAKGQPSYPLD